MREDPNRSRAALAANGRPGGFAEWMPGELIGRTDPQREVVVIDICLYHKASQLSIDPARFVGAVPTRSRYVMFTMSSDLMISASI
jgi:hypothetical protein